MPLVTIGIPTYRRPQLLRRAIASALAQDHGDVEVVISDNASGDDTDAVCREAVAADRRVRYVPQRENIGAVPNFLAALAAGTGSLFMWLGDDDWLEAFRSHPRIGESKAQRGTGAQAASWSAGEQKGVSTADDGTRAALAEGQRRYEDKFGFLFIVCASGRSPARPPQRIRARKASSPRDRTTQPVPRIRKERWPIVH